MLELNFKLEGEEEMVRRFRNISADLKDFRPEFQKSANFLKDFFGGEVFETRGAVIGEKWKPTKNLWPILERSGRMRRSFKTKADSKSAQVWNAVDYFAYHQSNKPRRKLPRRVMMKLDEARKQKITKIFQGSIVKVLRKR
jgi:phage gpG-like protein